MLPNSLLLFYKLNLKISMKKITKYLYVFIVGCLISQTSTAQNVWGAEATTGAADGQFQNNFIQSGTPANYSITDWTALSVYDNNGAVTPGNAFWTRTTTGRSQGQWVSGQPVISSPTRSTGAAIFDSDYLVSAGTGAGNGASLADHKGELISPRIDLSAYANTSLDIKFYSYYRNFQITELSVSFSTDDGATWGTAVDYRALQGSESEGFIDNVTIANTTGVANLTQCRVKFTFTGNNYFAIIDDLTLKVTALPVLLAMSPANNKTGVLPHSNLEIGFDKAITTNTGNITIYDAFNDAVIETLAVTSSNVTASGSVININPSNNLQSGKTYYVQIDAAAITDFGGISDKTTWRFTTATANNTAPLFTSSPVTSVVQNTNYTYTVTTSDANIDLTTITAPIVPSWLTFNNSTTVSTFAGTVGNTTTFDNPNGIVVDSQGNIYVANYYRSTILKITPEGVVSTFAGVPGATGHTDGTGAAARFNFPNNLAIDNQDNIYVADALNHKIRKITSLGVVTTLAGGGVNNAFGYTNATGTNARFKSINGLVIDSNGNVFVCDSGNRRIRKVSPAGVVTTFAGSGLSASTDGVGELAVIIPVRLTIDKNDNLYVTGDNKIRKITAEGIVSTITGSTAGFFDGVVATAQFNQASGITIDGKGNLYVAENGGRRIRKITPAGMVSTFAGTGANGSGDGAPLSATFNGASDITLDRNGNFYITDANSHTIRKIATNTSLTGVAPASTGTHNVTLNVNDGVVTTPQSFVINVVATTPIITTWTGATDTDWNTVTNWDNGIPTATTNTIITNVTNQPIINVAATTENLEIQTGASVIVNSGQSITIEGNITQNGNLVINSDATSNGSLIVKGSQLGTENISYNRYVSANWHLLAAPVTGVNITTLQGNLAFNNPKYAIAPYNNALASNRYVYFTNANISSAGYFTNAKGYSIKRNIAGVFNFLGNLNTSDIPMAITDGSATGNKWNLVGNPFTASLNGNSNADAVNNFLTVNASELDPVRVAMYVWDAANSSYDIINQATVGSKYIAPGQGFFVESKDNGGTLQFTEAMQSHQTGNIFSKTPNVVPSIELLVSDGTSQKSTDVKYFSTATVGLDPGYDAGIFSGESQAFNVFTQLVSNNNTTAFGIQCLPTNNYETMVIPVGVKAAENTTLSFSVAAQNLPNGINVYLEDKINNTFKQLNTTQANYTTTVSTAVNGVGRFYIHTTSSALGIDDNVAVLKSVHIYKSAKTTLTITGLPNQGKNTVKIFNILGKEVFSTSFTAQQKATIQLPVNISTGVYLVKLQTVKGNVHKKVILN